MPSKGDNYKSTLWERFAWVKQRAKTYKMKWGFFRSGRQLVNNVNTGISFSTLDNESKNGNLDTYT